MKYIELFPSHPSIHIKKRFLKAKQHLLHDIQSFEFDFVVKLPIFYQLSFFVQFVLFLEKGNKPMNASFRQKLVL